MSDSLRPSGLYSPWNSLGQNTGVGSLSLLQGIFPTQGSNAGLLHCRQISLLTETKGSPRILEWVAYPFSRGFSWPRNWTGVSCIAGRFFTSWAIREAHPGYYKYIYPKISFQHSPKLSPTSPLSPALHRIASLESLPWISEVSLSAWEQLLGKIKKRSSFLSWPCDAPKLGVTVMMGSLCLTVVEKKKKL